MSVVVNYDEIYFYINDECQGLAFKDKEVLGPGVCNAFVFIKSTSVKLAVVTGGTNKLYEPTAKLA